MNINEPRAGGGFAIPGLGGLRKTNSRTGSARPSSMKSNRVPFLHLIPDGARNHFVATSAEFAGTTLFLLFAFAGTQVALLGGASAPNEVMAPSDPSQLMYIALCFGFSLAVNAWVFFRISGGLFNPAVTLGMCLVGALPWIRGLFLFIAQVLGGITAAAICSAMLPGPLTVRTNLGGGTSVVQGLFIEMFLTAELVFTIFMLAAEKHKGTFIAPVGIGLSLFIAELMGVYFTGGSVNPARSFGPSVVSHSFHDYHWIYWVGPILGSLLASGFYKFIKMLEYETANPGQDSAERGEHFNPDLDTTNPRVAFAPEQYAMKEGRPGSNTTAVNPGSAGAVGIPQEYGASARPYSDSPAPPHKNDQFAGLQDGGMHAEEYVKPSPSDRTLTDTTPTTGNIINAHDNNAVHSAILPGPGAGASAVGGTTVPKSAIKHPRTAATRNGTYSNGGTSHSASSNMYANKQMNSGADRDEEFYDKA